MAKSLQEYLDWLDGRAGLLWPRPPVPRPLKATAFLKPLPGIKGVVWCAYGTLLTIDSGRLLHAHPQPFRMQLALEKTIEEFNMWQSMSRKPGAPWEYLLQQYTRLLEEQQLRATKRKGEVREVDSAVVWGKYLERLQKNDYRYDTSLYGSLEDLAVKVAYFFHANLQGVAACDGALETLRRVASAGLRQGVIDDGQAFTPAQFLRALRQQGQVNSLGDVITGGCLTLSHEHGVRKPSASLFAAGFSALMRHGLQAEEIVYVSHRLSDDLAAAKAFGVRTALLCADANCCQVNPAEVRDPAQKPDRLLTDLSQIGQILGI
jgi:FMN phosphatase YigB (HAD superfamily)